MDWIEEHLEKWKHKLKNYSLWKSMAFYMLIALLLTFIAAVFTKQVCESWQNVILQVGGIDGDYRYIGGGDFIYSATTAASVFLGQDIKSLDNPDKKLYVILEFVKTACIPFYSAGAILLVSFLYYRNKLKEPIFLLKQEMEAIRRDDLSLSCYYESADEMGEICGIMDKMRLSMQENRQKMLELMEEQRKINAAFAHDLRTPLTVINGYVEMMSDCYGKGQLDERQMEEMLSVISRQTKRVQAFSETMKDIQGFEVLEVKRAEHSKEELTREIKDMVKGVRSESGLAIDVSVKVEADHLYYDENVVMEVLGNLLSNATRYAKERIEIVAESEEEYLYIYVKDDGRGMTAEELYKADSPYYSDKVLTYAGAEISGKSEASKKIEASESKNPHFGLGLTICKILCKKHGGRLTLSNSIEGGAIVCGQFFVG